MPNSTAPRETQPIQSLDRGLVILEAVANSSDPVSLNDLTSLVGIDRSSVFRLAFTLKRRGFLAYPSGRKDFILGSAPVPIHPKRTIGSIAELAQACAQIQEQGYATDEAEFREGLRCVAAPIRAQRGIIVGSIGISAPAERFPIERYPEFSEQVRA